MCLEETVIIPMRLNNGFPYYVVTFVDDRKLQSMHLRIFFHRARIQPWYIRRSVQGGLVSKDAGGSRGQRLKLRKLSPSHPLPQSCRVRVFQRNFWITSPTFYATEKRLRAVVSFPNHGSHAPESISSPASHSTPR